MYTRLFSLSPLAVVGLAFTFHTLAFGQNATGPAGEESATSDKAYLGVQLGPVPELLAMHLPDVLDSDSGLVIVGVSPGSPAARDGLQPNDILVGFDSQEVSSYDALIQYVNQSKPDQTVQLKVIRRGKPLNVKVKLGAQPTDFTANQPLGRWPTVPSVPGMPDFDALRGGGNLHDMQKSMERMNKMMEQMNQEFNKSFGGTMPNMPPTPKFDPDSFSSSASSSSSSNFSSIQVNKTGGNQYKVGVKYKAKDGEVRELNVEGTAEEVRKAAQEDDKMPAAVRKQLFKALQTGSPDPLQNNA